MYKKLTNNTICRNWKQRQTWFRRKKKHDDARMLREPPYIYKQPGALTLQLSSRLVSDLRNCEKSICLVRNSVSLAIIFLVSIAKYRYSKYLKSHVSKRRMQASFDQNQALRSSERS